jgi:PPM family protein phosphatase
MAYQEMLNQVSVYCISDIGLIRQNNEDYWKILKDQQFFVLADGMGGHQAGEVASKATVEQLCQLFQQHYDSLPKEIDQAKQVLKEMIQEVNGMVYRLGRENLSLRGMGTTLCCLFFHSEGLIYAHVGDSRIYRFRKNTLEQLTQDHSLLCELIEMGQLSEQQAEDFLYKNIITKAIGTEPYVEAAVADTLVQPGDILMMCTDGLTDLVGFEEMRGILKENREEEVINLLVEKAKEKGGYDNITIILVKVLDKYATHLS